MFLYIYIYPYKQKHVQDIRRDVTFSSAKVKSKAQAQAVVKGYQPPVVTIELLLSISLSYSSMDLKEITHSLYQLHIQTP